jgi:hypothetical protein
MAMAVAITACTMATGDIIMAGTSAVVTGITGIELPRRVVITRERVRR